MFLLIHKNTLNTLSKSTPIFGQVMSPSPLWSNVSKVTSIWDNSLIVFYQSTNKSINQTFMRVLWRWKIDMIHDPYMVGGIIGGNLHIDQDKYPEREMIE